MKMCDNVMMNIRMILFLLFWAATLQALDNAFMVKLEGMTGVTLVVSLATDIRELEERKFRQAVTSYFAEDGFLKITDRSQDRFELDLISYDVVEMKTIYFKMELVLRRSGTRIWGMNCSGMVSEQEAPGIVWHKLRTLLDNFYYQYLNVNHIRKLSRKKILNYSQWHHTKILNRKSSHTDYHIPDLRH
ncbi:MAG: hypothetical protein PHQ23_01585 [Candidatus Wallbacteria bacterium]|nr:hypothetical protein [Candidatus Wallbacteria bacterium]